MTRPLAAPVAALLAVAVGLALPHPAAARDAPGKPPAPRAATPLDEAGQLVVVTTPAWSATTGTLRRFERQGAGWREVGPRVPVQVGRTGLGWGRGRFPTPSETPPPGPVKREGDKRAPAGIFTLGQATGYAPARPNGSRLLYRQATPTLRCVDDPASPEYNHLALAPADGSAPPWRSDEKMRRGDGLYELTLFVEHNAGKPEPGAGSCIFLHVVDKVPRPTVGCTAMTLPSLRELFVFLDPARRPLLVQLPEPSYAALQKRLGLPSLR